MLNLIQLKNSINDLLQKRLKIFNAFPLRFNSDGLGYNKHFSSEISYFIYYDVVVNFPSANTSVDDFESKSTHFEFVYAKPKIWEMYLAQDLIASPLYFFLTLKNIKIKIHGDPSFCLINDNCFYPLIQQDFKSFMLAERFNIENSPHPVLYKLVHTQLEHDVLNEISKIKSFENFCAFTFDQLVFCLQQYEFFTATSNFFWIYLIGIIKHIAKDSTSKFILNETAYDDPILIIASYSESFKKKALFLYVNTLTTSIENTISTTQGRNDKVTPKI